MPESTTLTAPEPVPAAAARRPVVRRALAWLDTAWAGAAVVLLLSAILWAPRLTGPIDLRYDAGVYYVLGTSLAEGQGFRIGSEPGEPVGVQYPPVLPAWVALNQWVLGTSDPAVVGPWLRWGYLAMFVGLGLALWAIARRFLPGRWSIVVVTICFLQVHTYLLSDLLFTELPFTLLSVVAVLVMLRGADGAGRRPGRELALFGLGSVAFLLRTAGIAFLVAWVGEAVWRRRWRLAALRAVLACLPVVAWQVHVNRTKASEAYLEPAYAYQRADYMFYNVPYGENVLLVDPFQPELGRVTLVGLVGRALTNMTAIPTALGEAVSEPAGFWRWIMEEARGRVGGPEEVPAWAARPPLWILAGLTLLGLVRLARAGAVVVVLLVLGSIGLVCLTPWPGQFSRYLAPIIPFLAVAAMLGGRTLWAWADARGRRSRRGLAGAGLVLAGLIAVVQVGTWCATFRNHHRSHVLAELSARMGSRLFYHARPWNEWEQAMGWILRHAPPEAVHASAAPHLGYLVTGSQAVMPPMVDDPVLANELLDSVPVRFAVVDELDFIDISQRYLGPAVESRPDRWREVARFGGTRIFERLGGDAAAAAGLAR